MVCSEQLFFTNDFWDNLRRMLDINTLAILVDHYFNSPLSLFLGVFFGFFLFLIIMTYFTALCLRTKIRTVQEQQQRFLSYVHPDFSEVKDVKTGLSVRFEERNEMEERIAGARREQFAREYMMQYQNNYIDRKNESNLNNEVDSDGSGEVLLQSMESSSEESGIGEECQFEKQPDEQKPEEKLSKKQPTKKPSLNNHSENLLNTMYKLFRRAEQLEKKENKSKNKVRIKEKSACFKDPLLLDDKTISQTHKNQRQQLFTFYINKLANQKIHTVNYYSYTLYYPKDFPEAEKLDPSCMIHEKKSNLLHIINRKITSFDRKTTKLMNRRRPEKFGKNYLALLDPMPLEEQDLYDLIRQKYFETNESNVMKLTIKEKDRKIDLNIKKAL